MTIPAPSRILLSVQNPDIESFLPRFIYVCGDPMNEETRSVLELMVPLSAGDFIHVALNGEGKPIRRQVQTIEFHELDMKGLGDSMFTPCLTFSE